MQLPPFEYLKPDSLEQGLRWLAEPDTSVLAGGSDLLVNMKLRLVTPRRLLSIRHLPGMRSVSRESDGQLRIGAGAGLSDLLAEPLLRDAYPALAAAIRAVGSQHVRHLGTLGGNICLPTRCWFTNQSEDWRSSRQPCFKTDGGLCHVIKGSEHCHALNSSDTAPVLIALNASLEIVGLDGMRSLPIAAFYCDDGIDSMNLQPGEILTAVRLPPPNGCSAYIKVAQRDGLDYAAGSIAGWRNADEVRLVVGSIASWPVPLHRAAAVIHERGWNDAAISAAATAAREDLGEVSNLFSPPGYKRRLVRSLVQRMLRQLAQSPAAES